MVMRAPEISRVRVSTVKTVVDPRRRQEVDLHAPHDPGDALAMFSVRKFGMMNAGHAQEMGASPLQEFEVAGMVDDAGEIGVRVVDARRQPMAGGGQHAGQTGGEGSLFAAIGHRAFLPPVGLTLSCVANRMALMTGMFKVCPLARLGPVLAARLLEKRGTLFPGLAGRGIPSCGSIAAGVGIFCQAGHQSRHMDDLAIRATMGRPQCPAPLSGMAEKSLSRPICRRSRLPASISCACRSIPHRSCPIVPPLSLMNYSHRCWISARMVNAAGLKAVVDLHLVPAGERSVGTQEVLNDPALFERYTEIVRRMADTLAGEDPSRICA